MSVMKIIVSIALFLALLLTNLLPIGAQENTDFSSRKVFKGSLPGLGLSAADLQKIAGRPLKKIPGGQVDSCNGVYTTWTYKDFSVETYVYADGSGEKVGTLSVESPSWVTLKGVRIGDQLSKAAKLYNTKITTNSYLKRQEVSIPHDSDGGSLTFGSDRNGRIKVILLTTEC
jgi:hypothetical protein